MIRSAVDLHLHSCLSPCGDTDMTPNNIVNMALLNELDWIAVTDHNSAGNLPAVMKVAKDTGLKVLPGIEVTTKEEMHILSYFGDLDAVMELDRILYDSLPDIKNRPDYFGEQLILDEDDEIVGHRDKLLISAVNFGINKLAEIVKELHGVIVPAHIDRPTYSIMVSLGFIPPDLPITTVEVSGKGSVEDVKKRFRFFKPVQFIQSSDAHYLEDISQRAEMPPQRFLELEDLRHDTLLHWLGSEMYP